MTNGKGEEAKEWIEKYKGKFDGGWDKLREETFARQTKLDVYEGMRHVFQQTPIPESEVAINKSAQFINDHLK